MAALEYRVRWPKEFRPLHTPLHIANELTMEVETRAIWAMLVSPLEWAGFWPGATEMKIAGEPMLENGSRFTWRVFGMRLSAVVEEFVPEKRIAWRQKGLGVTAYHVWLVRERPSGTYIRSEESFLGWRPRWSRGLNRQAMQLEHQAWLEGLERAGAAKALQLKQDEERRAAEKLAEERRKRAEEKAARLAQYEAERIWAEEQQEIRRRAAEEAAARGEGEAPPPEPAKLVVEDDEGGWDE